MNKITPIAPGWLLTKPYLPKDSLFHSIKETSGETMRSEVLEVGADLVDDNNILRKAPCKKGEIIFHKYISEDFNIATDKFRFVHFADYRGTWKEEI